jgi:glycosyltransferase involved in cell wall biosynthesis
MKQWPKNSVLVLAGSVTDAYRTQLLAAAEAAGVADRIIFLGVVSPDDIWAIRAGADVALTIMEPQGSLNRELAAGASNKRFEAMAAGVAQVSDCNPGVPEIVEQTGVGICVLHDDPASIGGAVARLLNDAGLCQQMGGRARQIHLDRFNYEAEFAPVLNRLLDLMWQQRRR